MKIITFSKYACLLYYIYNISTYIHTYIYIYIYIGKIIGGNTKSNNKVKEKRNILERNRKCNPCCSRKIYYAVTTLKQQHHFLVAKTKGLLVSFIISIAKVNLWSILWNAFYATCNTLKIPKHHLTSLNTNHRSYVKNTIGLKNTYNWLL